MKRRFEIKMPPEQRRELDALAQELGMSAADVARVGVHWVLRHRKILLGGPAVAARTMRKAAATSKRAA
jgi:hypothetical protein